MEYRPKKTRREKPDSVRRERLKSALKANIMRRKKQAEARGNPPSGPDGSDGR